MKKPTEIIRDAINELCGYNDRTKGAEAGDMYLSGEIFVTRLKRTRIIDGEWVDIDNVVDIEDLMRWHQEGK